MTKLGLWGKQELRLVYLVEEKVFRNFNRKVFVKYINTGKGYQDGKGQRHLVQELKRAPAPQNDKGSLDNYDV